MYELLIKGAMVAYGLGGEPVRADLAVAGERLTGERPPGHAPDAVAA